MSLTIEEKPPPGQLSEIEDGERKKPKISYTRDFLLSFSELDVCKKLPSGFDQSLLSEFADASQDRQRPLDRLPMSSYRRVEYGSSPPTRGDLTSHSRGIQGRWESRSSGRTDRDSDSQSERDSDSGRRYGNQTRRSWQVPEHDGLLGSGSFPRPSGYAAGASAPKVRPNEHYQLNKSNEPYQPPRPYKAVPHRRDTDSFNNETFGSSECASEDRAEEERKRRASFELMRKEQHRTFQDKHKLNLDKNKDDFDISTLVEESKEETGSLKKNNGLDELVKPLALDKDSEKSSAPAQTHAPRPLVPPGFASSVLDRSLGAKSLNHNHAAEVGHPETEDNLLHGKSKAAVNSASEDQQLLAEEINSRKQQPINTQRGKNLDSSSVLDVSNILYDKTNIGQAFEASKSGEVTELNDKKLNGPSILGNSNKDHSILDKLFGSALALNDSGPSVLEDHEIKTTETQSPRSFQSSKFARWFPEEEKKTGSDQSSGRPNDLLSLIVGGDKVGSRVSGNESDQSLHNLTFQNSENVDKLAISDAISVKVGSFDKLHKDSKPEPVPSVLTCEDLEQSILSEINVTGPKIQPPPVLSWTDTFEKQEQPKANSDNLASRHLLSLLQKGVSLNDTTESSSNHISFSDKPQGIEEPSIGIALNGSREAKVENVSDSGKTLTLETLFGSAFMKELQSVGAPVSSQRGPAGPAKVDSSEPHGFPFNGVDILLPPNETGFSSSVLDGGNLGANTRKQTRMDKIEEPWLKWDDPQAEQASQLRPNYGSKTGGFNGPADVRLPEEDTLIAAIASDPLALENFMPPGSTVKNDLLSASNAQADLAEKLASFNSAFRDERIIRGGQEPPFSRGPYDMRESNHPYQNPNAQPSFAQLHHQQLNNMGPMFPPPLDSHPMNVNSQMKFMAPEAVAHHDPVPNHPMPMNIFRPPFHHPSSGLTGFDQPIPHSMLHPMQMQANLPPNLLQGLPPRGPSMPPHPNRSASMPTHPNFGSLGMPLPVHDVSGGSNSPEMLQRLIEMELRSNPKQMHPFAAGGQSHGTYGHELDMGFGFR